MGEPEDEIGHELLDFPLKAGFEHECGEPASSINLREEEGDQDGREEMRKALKSERKVEEAYGERVGHLTTPLRGLFNNPARGNNFPPRHVWIHIWQRHRVHSDDVTLLVPRAAVT